MLEILISSSVLILMLAILRLVLRDKISARLQYALWLLVLVRLLVPVSFFHSPVSVAEAAAPTVMRVEALSDTVVTYERIYRGTVAPVKPGTMGTVEQTIIVPSRTVRDIARYIRYAGMAVMAGWFLFVNVRLSRKLRKSRVPYGKGVRLPVYVAEGIPSPCLFGLLRPTVYLTDQAASDPAQARQITAHEETHFRHGDMIWTLLRSICLMVWWFNPLVWLAAALSRQDCELACDEGTIKALGEDARFDYGRTLVGMAKVGASPSELLCGATTMTTGRRSLKERVTRIAQARKMTVTTAVVTLLIAAVAAGCTFSGAASSESSADADALPGEVIGTYDRDYREEVDRELASFAYPVDIEVFISPYHEFDEELPEDDIFGPLTPEDYIYGTDGWQFRYNGELIANDPAATIKVHDADGRTLWIMEDADALMIEEADGSITWVTYQSDPVDCADMIRHLLLWARGEYPTAEEQAAARAEVLEAEAQKIVAELGYFGLPDLEAVHMEAGTACPFWADFSDPRDLAGPWVTLYYGPDDFTADLRYERIQANSDPTQPLGAESYEMCRDFFAASESVTDVKVNALSGFVTDGAAYQGPRLVWFNADLDLLFSLIAYHADAGQPTKSFSTDELIALAESITAQ